MYTELLANIAILVLSGFVGFAVISKVPNTLHTPLMSGTNAIHGIVVLGALVTLGAGRAQAQAAGLEAHAAVGRVVAGFLVEGELVRAHELVAAAHGDVALEHRVGVGAGEQVAFDVGGCLAGRIDVQPFRRLHGVSERRHHVAERA